ncbi:MAG: Hsp20/alpha crystallin family protein [Acidimicrobiia bacterium]|nr:Hsp20/alpha crystallin family protein [Acidimicrobiia bacterium]
MAEIEKAPTRSEWPDLFGRWFSDWPRWPDVWRGFLETAAPVMKVEEYVEDDTLVVKAEMPGIDPEKDVEIQVSDQMLRIRAERREEEKVEEKGRYRSEFQYGSFSRSVPLPAGCSEEDVKATYRDGILEVRVPIRKEVAEARRIPIQRT